MWGNPNTCLSLLISYQIIKQPFLESWNHLPCQSLILNSFSAAAHQHHSKHTNYYVIVFNVYICMLVLIIYTGALMYSPNWKLMILDNQSKVVISRKLLSHVFGFYVVLNFLKFIAVWVSFPFTWHYQSSFYLNSIQKDLSSISFVYTSQTNLIIGICSMYISKNSRQRWSDIAD